MKHATLRFKKHIVPFLGPMTAAYITEAEIRKYESSRRKAGAAKATIRRKLELVKRAFTLGRRAYKIQGPYIELPKIQNARSGFFEEADFLKIKAVIEEDYRPFLLLAYITGWRTGEIKNLRRRRLDFAGCCIRLDPGTTKNGDARVFPMKFGGLEDMLRQQTQGLGFPDDYVFTYQGRIIFPKSGARNH